VRPSSCWRFRAVVDIRRQTCASYNHLDTVRRPDGERWGCAQARQRRSAGVPVASRAALRPVAARRSRALDPLEVNAATEASGAVSVGELTRRMCRSFPVG